VCTGNRLPRADSIQPFAIGTAMTSTDAAAGFFPGAIDEVRVWNYARTAAQILGGMSDSTRSDSGNPVARLLGRWGLDEGAGTAAGDSAGYANSGTLVGNAAFASAGLTPLTGCVSSYSPSAGCCVTSADCNDGNASTTDLCTGDMVTFRYNAGKGVTFKKESGSTNRAGVTASSVDAVAGDAQAKVSEAADGSKTEARRASNAKRLAGFFA